jgi:hypothetical protein
MVSASCVRGTAPADTDMLASETNRSDGQRATGLILERRPNQKATVSDGGNNSIEAENSSSCTIQINMSRHSTRWHLPVTNGTRLVDGGFRSNDSLPKLSLSAGSTIARASSGSRLSAKNFTTRAAPPPGVSPPKIHLA